MIELPPQASTDPIQSPHPGTVVDEVASSEPDMDVFTRVCQWSSGNQIRQTSVLQFLLRYCFKSQGICLRILDSYDAKIIKICNFWTFWPVIQLISPLFKNNLKFQGICYTCNVLTLCYLNEINIIEINK